MRSLDRFSSGLADPQEREPLVVDTCTYCGDVLNPGDKVVRDKDTDHRFCGARCYTLWLILRGRAEYETLEKGAV